MARVSPSKRWCFTLNNYTEENVLDLMVHLDSLRADFVIGFEVGASGTRHLQGCIQRPGKWRPLPLLKGCLGRAHFEKCKGSWLQNVQYCTKDGSYTASFDVPQFLRSKMPILELEDEVRALALEAKQEVHEIWVNRGKPVEDCSCDSLAYMEWAAAHEQLSARLTL
jgi:hypothetical protein